MFLLLCRSLDFYVLHPHERHQNPDEKLIQCMHMISLHKDNKITKRELKDLALNKNLIQVGKKDTLDKEERSDQAAYVALNKNLIDPLMDWKAYLALKSSEIIE